MKKEYDDDAALDMPSLLSSLLSSLLNLTLAAVTDVMTNEEEFK